jgi:uncharacterized protein YjcR
VAVAVAEDQYEDDNADEEGIESTLKVITEHATPTILHAQLKQTSKKQLIILSYCNNRQRLMNFIFSVEKLVALQKTCKKQRAEIKELKSKLHELTTTNEELQELYPGASLKIKPTLLASLTGATLREGSQIRNLIRAFFTEQELLDSSRTGKRSPANLKRSQETLPGLDPEKLKTIMGKPQASLASS